VQQDLALALVRDEGIAGGHRAGALAIPSTWSGLQESPVCAGSDPSSSTRGR